MVLQVETLQRELNQVQLKEESTLINTSNDELLKVIKTNENLILSKTLLEEECKHEVNHITNENLSLKETIRDLTEQGLKKVSELKELDAKVSRNNDLIENLQSSLLASNERALEMEMQVIRFVYCNSVSVIGLVEFLMGGD